MSSIQIKNHRIGTYEVNKKNLSYFDKIDILKNGHDGLTLGYLSWLKKLMNSFFAKS